MKRRLFLGGSTSVLTLGLAGCLDESDPATGPETVSEAFVAAAADGDTDQQEALLHPESTINPVEDEVELLETDIEAISLETFVEETTTGPREARIDQQQAQLDDLLDEIDADDYAYVWYGFDTGEHGSDAGHLLVVQDGGEWLIYQFVREESAGDTTVPQLSVEYQFESPSELTLTHGGGDHVDASRLALEVGETDVFSEPAEWDASGWEDTVQVGDSLTVVDSSETDHSGEDIRLIWQSSGGDGSTVISSRQWP